MCNSRRGPGLGRVGPVLGWWWTSMLLGSAGVCWSHVASDDIVNDLDKPVPLAQVTGVAGRKAALPCDTTPRAQPDHVSMVLWFKEDGNEPLYSYDVRGRLAWHPKLWSSSSVFGARAFFRATTSPAALLIEGVMSSDAGVYRCRVDFKNSPTRNLRLNFTVITPPNRPVIMDAKSRDVMNLQQTYNEGDNVELICEAVGGEPRPRVLWYLENDLIDDSFERHGGGGDVTSNGLTFPHVGRQHHAARLVCQATNTDLAPPETKVLILNINLKPLAVQIVGKSRQLSADRSYEVQCRSVGARPNATLTWWKAGRQIKRNVDTLYESNATVSVLLFTPTQQDDGLTLVCRAENPRVPHSAIQDSWTLDVYYVPVVALKLGSSLDRDNIKEGDDVYFECSVQANPKAHRLSWYREEQEVFQNATIGIILSDQSLVLQRVTRTAAGEYSCLAHNHEGSTRSNSVSLIVNYAPECVSEARSVAVAAGAAPAPVRCDVDARPPPHRWQWALRRHGPDLHYNESNFNSSGLASTLLFSVSRDTDYGSLVCSATNSVGEMDKPCVFSVRAASPPSPVQNCTLNMTSSIRVLCKEGYNGGLPQMFILEVLSLPDLVVVANVSSSSPSFRAAVDARGEYRLRVFASNARGRSAPAVLHARRAWRAPDKFTDSRAPPSLPAWMAALLAVAALLLAAACGTLAALYRSLVNKGSTKPPSTPASSNLFMERSVDTSKGNTYTAAAVMEYCHLEVKDPGDDADPDVIPCHFDRNTGVGDCNNDPELQSVSISVVNRGVTARSVEISAASRDIIAGRDATLGLGATLGPETSIGLGTTLCQDATLCRDIPLVQDNNCGRNLEYNITFPAVKESCI